MNLTREIFTAQGQALWHEGVVGLPLFLLFLFLAVIFSILALYFSYLFRMPEFGTLFITGRSSVAETGQHEEPSTLSQRVQDFFSGPYSGWLWGFALVYSVLTVWYIIASVYTVGLQHNPYSLINFMSTLFLLSLLACFLLAHRVLKASEYIIEAQNRLHSDNLIQEIVCVLPRRVHVNESHDVLMEFTLSEQEGSVIPGKTDVIEHDAHFEAELRTAGVSVDKKMRLFAISNISTCIWNCYFQNKGNLTVNLILSSVRSTEIKDVIFAYKHDIKVDSAFSASVQPIITIGVSILSAIVALYSIFGPH